MISAMKKGEELKPKTQDQITEEIASKYKACLKPILSVQ